MHFRGKQKCQSTFRDALRKETALPIEPFEPFAGPFEPFIDVRLLHRLNEDKVRRCRACDLSTILEYASHPVDKFPPIILTKTGILIDGVHRLSAALRRGNTTIHVIWE